MAKLLGHRRLVNATNPLRAVDSKCSRRQTAKARPTAVSQCRTSFLLILTASVSADSKHGSLAVPQGEHNTCGAPHGVHRYYGHLQARRADMTTQRHPLPHAPIKGTHRQDGYQQIVFS
ncbi:hypothetical protein BV20DRAFT_38562 [Pilatotrama ljubarskyi]|nr:hypothetical protein BV20DRAFT_38562 [Pilatotrama ljubarskyi]